MEKDLGSQKMSARRTGIEATDFGIFVLRFSSMMSGSNQKSNKQMTQD